MDECVDRDLVMIQHAYVLSLQESRHKHKSACKHGTLGAFLSPTGGTVVKGENGNIGN